TEAVLGRTRKGAGLALFCCAFVGVPRQCRVRHSYFSGCDHDILPHFQTLLCITAVEVARITGKHAVPAKLLAKTNSHWPWRPAGCFRRLLQLYDADAYR